MLITSDMIPTRAVFPLFYNEEAEDTHVTCTMALAEPSWESCALLDPMAPTMHEVLEAKTCVSHTVFFFPKAITEPLSICVR